MYKKNNFYSIFLKKFITPVADTLVGTRVNYYYNKITKMNLQSKKEIDFWQNEKLRQLIIHAYENTDYYRELFDRNNIRPYEVKDKSILKFIPRLRKKDIIDNYERLIPSNISRIFSVFVFGFLNGFAIV